MSAGIERATGPMVLGIPIEHITGHVFGGPHAIMMIIYLVNGLVQIIQHTHSMFSTDFAWRINQGLINSMVSIAQVYFPPINTEISSQIPRLTQDLITRLKYSKSCAVYGVYDEHYALAERYIENWRMSKITDLENFLRFVICFTVMNPSHENIMDFIVAFVFFAQNPRPRDFETAKDWSWPDDL